MEEEKKTQPTSENESNPNEEDEVNTTDLLGEGEDDKGKSAEAGKETPTDETEAEKDGKPESKPQDRETNAKNAERRRRQKEREEQRQKEREEEIRRQAVFEVKSGQVTEEELRDLSLTKVETEEQLFLVEQFRKAKSEGNENPLAEAYKALFKKQNEDKAQAEAKAKEEAEVEQRRKEIVMKDQQAFKAKFGKTTAEVIKNEEEFMSLFGNLIDQDKGNFTELYSAYIAMKQNRKDTAKKEGAFPTNNSSTSDGNSGNMTDEEFKKYYIGKYGHF